MALHKSHPLRLSIIITQLMVFCALSLADCHSQNSTSKLEIKTKWAFQNKIPVQVTQEAQLLNQK